MLETSWRETAGNAGIAKPGANAVLGDLCRRYCESGRAYHNLDHVMAMLDAVSGFAEDLHDPVAVRLAVWFHDAVYDPRRNDNEEESAAYASVALSRAGALPTLLPTIERLILATKTHQTPLDDTDCHILLDADLAVLGSSEADYDRYARAIRAEYAWVPEQDYRAGRKKVLEGFLEHDRLYYTEALFNTHEAAARANLRREIESLA